MKPVFDFIKEFPIPSALSIFGTVLFHAYVVNAYRLSTANPARMGQLYFIVFVVLLLPTIGIQVLIEKRSRK